MSARTVKRVAKVTVSPKDVRVIGAYLGVEKPTDEDVERYLNGAIRACLEQDECYLKAKTDRGRMRHRIAQGRPS